MAAFEPGYYVAIPEDAFSSWNQELHQGSFENINHCFGITPSVADIIKDWE